MLDLIDVEAIPTLTPNVEHILLLQLAKEVEDYNVTIDGTKCLLCPFRTFSRLAYIKIHMKHHCANNMYVADIRSPQRLVVRALFDYHQAITPITENKHQQLNLLIKSASHIRK